MSKSKRISLSAERRLLLVFVLSTVAVIVLVGWGVQYFIERVELSRTKVNLESWANLLARRADEELADGQRAIEFLAKAPAFQRLPYVDLIDNKIHGIPENVDVEKTADDELERFQRLTVGRELKMIELKMEVNALLKQAGQPEEYKIVAGKPG
jgi:hypothetical protein